jgi:hypothetical protein
MLYGQPPAAPQGQPPYAPQQPYPAYPGAPVQPPAHGAPGQAPDTAKFNWDQPEQSIDQRVEPRLQQIQNQFNSIMAQSNFFNGRSTAMAQRPDLYKGIEREVESTMQNAWRYGTINAASLVDPETWHTAAWAIQGRKQGFKNPANAPASGTAPAFNETPQGGRLQQPTPKTFRIAKTDANLDEEKMRIGLGFSEKETAELLEGGEK